MLIIWRWLNAGVVQGVFVFSVVQYEPLVYMNYRYPAWGEGIGWMMALSSIIVIPGYAIYLLIVTPGNMRQVFSTSIVLYGDKKVTDFPILNDCVLPNVHVAWSGPFIAINYNGAATPWPILGETIFNVQYSNFW